MRGGQEHVPLHLVVADHRIFRQLQGDEDAAAAEQRPGRVIESLSLAYDRIEEIKAFPVLDDLVRLAHHAQHLLIVQANHRILALDLRADDRDTVHLRLAPDEERTLLTFRVQAGQPHARRRRDLLLHLRAQLVPGRLARIHHAGLPISDFQFVCHRFALSQQG